MTAAEIEKWAVLTGVAVCLIGLLIVGFLYWRTERRRPARPSLPRQPKGAGYCAMCWTAPGQEHELSCDHVSLEQFRAYIAARQNEVQS